MRNQIPAAAVLAAAAVLLTACGSASPAPAASAAAHAKAAAKPKHGSAAKAIDACYKRRAASGDIYVRTSAPGTPATAQQLGGEWTWDYTAGKCVTSVQLAIATAATDPGDCTTVGFVSDNPGYDPNATPARRLKVPDAQAGPGC